MEKPLIPKTVATLILAGGKSSRMGQDKALLSIHELPLICHIYNVAIQCCTPVFVISPWCDRYRPILPITCHFIDEKSDVDVDIVIDEKKRGKRSEKKDSQGPLIGFYQGFTTILTQVNVEWILLLACDLPNLDPAIIQSWATMLSDIPDSTIAALPPHITSASNPLRHPSNFKNRDSTLNFQSSKQWHPLCGFYHRRCLPSLTQFIEADGRSFQRWLAHEEVRSLPIPHPKLLFNCNTPEDWHRLRQQK